MMSHWFKKSCSAAALVLCLGSAVQAADNQVAAVDQQLVEPATKGANVKMRWLTESQYRAIIADVFGSSVTVASRFDPVPRNNGLLAVGTSLVDMTPAAFERYERLARSVATQIVEPSRREALLSCKPSSLKKPDDACAKQVFKNVGRLLYRRPLTNSEIQAHVDIAKEATRKRGDFYAGIERGLTAMLMAPNFLYVIPTAQPDPDQPGEMRLDDYSMASRLSFFLWNTTPDDELLKAAERGELHSKEGIARQAERMLASPRLQDGVRAFFSDMLMFEHFETLSKDAEIYPAFNHKVATDSQEQTLRTIADHLITRHGDYRDLFTTRNTFLSPALGIVYRVPVNRPEGAWVPYQVPDGDERIGIIPQISFVAMHSHSGKSSPTLRGRAVREILMCQRVPDPPGNIAFDLFNDPNSPHRTARERLTVHRNNPACAGCHKLVDPIGLTLENYDGLGQFRTTENGAPIDKSGELNGVKFEGASGLAKVIRDEPAVPKCLVNRLSAYAMGNITTRENKDWVTYLEKSFVADGYRVPELMRRIVTSEAFTKVVPKADSAPPTKSAADGTVRKEEKS